MKIEEIEKLARLEKLEKELGCPIDVVIRALRDGVYCIDTTTGEMKFVLKRLKTLEKNSGAVWGFLDDRAMYKHKSRDLNLDVEIPEGYAWSSYKKTWWLKADKSE